MNEPKLLLDRIHHHAKQTPKAEALGAPGRKCLTYYGLWEQITSVASRFHGMGLSDRTIAVALPDGPELAALMLGITSIAECAILDPSSRSEEFDYYLTDLNTQTLVVLSGTDCAAVPIAKQKGIRVLEIIPNIESESGVFDLAGSARHDSIPTSSRRAHEHALKIYTSGTTGRPKAVCLNHLVISEAARNLGDTLQLVPTDRCLNVMPMFHVHALIIAIASSLYNGGSIICTRGFEIGNFFKWMESAQPTWYTASPAIHKSVLEEADRSGIRNLPLRLIRSSASSLSQKVKNRIEDLFKIPVLEGYGMTECPLIAGNSWPPAKQKLGSVGKPAGPELQIVDENRNPVKAGNKGEIMIRGDSVAAPLNSWFQTGDTGFQDEEGYVFLTGRLKEIINRGGQKISPLEVNSVLQQHPCVAEAFTFGFEHETLGEEIAAAVILRENSPATEKEIRSFTLQKLVDYKVPRCILFVEEFPRTNTGKILRRELVNRLHSARETQTAQTSYNSIEIRLQELWCEVLGIHPIGIHDDFFRLGGESILATRLVSRIRNEFHVELPLRCFFEAPSIAEVSAQIQSGISPSFMEVVSPNTAKFAELSKRPCSDQENQKTKNAMQFSLFFFSADGSTTSQNKYRLLMESVKFADVNHFKAVWLPERHFHPFGGLYPNPSVLAAAIATVTKKIQIRAGSVVLPLQNPIRVAEEWSVVDNLSNGRVAISCASGWQANDFVLSPADYSERRKLMFERIEIIRKLWRGEKLTLPNGAGNLTEVGIYPKPLQTTLPIWISCHSDESFRQAGRMGFNIITTVYNSTIDRVAEQISLYKKEFQESGHDPERRTITMMLHTFLEMNEKMLAEKVKTAYADYLCSFLGLQKSQAEGLGQHFDLTESDRTFLLSRGVDRLYDVRDLVGTLETCAQKVKTIQAIGVDEIACLIDFGIDFDSTLASLRHLNTLRLMAEDSK